MKKSFIIHPFLFAIFPILFLFSHNMGEPTQATYLGILLLIGIAICFTFLILFLSKLIFKNEIKASIIVSISWVIFFSYGHIYGMINSWEIGGFLIVRHRYLIFTMCVLFTFLTYFIVKTRKNLNELIKMLNLMGIILIFIPTYNIGVYLFDLTKIGYIENVNIKDKGFNARELDNTTRQPDIYYIILDGYASSSSLEEFFNYDNHDFTNYLIEKGFYVATKSQSNYLSTYLSLASSLNMQYINNLIDLYDDKSVASRQIHNMFVNNKVMRILGKKGYKCVSIIDDSFNPKSTPYEMQILSPIMKNIYLTDFTAILLNTTLLVPILDRFNFYYKEIWKYNLDQFSLLENTPGIENPKFVFAHIFSPHPPYIFDQNGNFKETKSTSSNWEYPDEYLEELIFVNKKVKDIVDEIFSKSKIPPIIIIQGDHGPHLRPWASSLGDDAPHHYEDAYDERNVKMFTGIINAYYLPNIDNTIMYESITPVNTFRLIFSEYFNERYDLLEDKVYYISPKKVYEDFVKGNVLNVKNKNLFK